MVLLLFTENPCLNMATNTPAYMTPVLPGSLLQLVHDPQYLPPAEAPNPLLTDSDVIEPPLPPVAGKEAPSPGNGTTAAPPRLNGQPKITPGIFFSSLATLVATLLL